MPLSVEANNEMVKNKQSHRGSGFLNLIKLPALPQVPIAATAQLDYKNSQDFGIEMEVGTIAPGKLADIVVVYGYPYRTLVFCMMRQP